MGGIEEGRGMEDGWKEKEEPRGRKKDRKSFVKKGGG
jgi:hypothetical protein